MVRCWICDRRKWLGRHWHHEIESIFWYCPHCWATIVADQERAEQALQAERQTRLHLEEVIEHDLTTAIAEVRGLALLNGDLGGMLLKDGGVIPGVDRSKEFLWWLNGLPTVVLGRCIREGSTGRNEIPGDALAWLIERAYLSGDSIGDDLAQALLESENRDTRVWTAFIRKYFSAFKAEGRGFARLPSRALDTFVWYLGAAAPFAETYGKSPHISDRNRVQSWLLQLAEERLAEIDAEGQARIVGALTNFLTAPFEFDPGTLNQSVGWDPDKLARCCQALASIGGPDVPQTIGTAIRRIDAAYRSSLEWAMRGDSDDHARVAGRELSEWDSLKKKFAGENASVVMGPSMGPAATDEDSPAAPRESQSPAVTLSLVTDWHYWRCPGCGEVLQKAALGTMWQAGESLEKVHGEGACTACGGRFPQVDIYGGRYDSQPPAPSRVASSRTTLRKVSLVVFREGEEQPADPERYYTEILERKFTGRQVHVKTWRIVGVKEAVRDPDHACVLYARLAEQGQLPRLGEPFDEFQGATSDGRKVVTLFFADD